MFLKPSISSRGV